MNSEMEFVAIESLNTAGFVAEPSMPLTRSADCPATFLMLIFAWNSQTK